MPLAEYQHMPAGGPRLPAGYFEDFSGEGGEDYLERHITLEGNDPLTLLLDSNMRDVLIKAIDDLPEREKTVMGLYYEQDMNLREIGEVLGVSESRVCQLHSQAIARLRSRISGADPGRTQGQGRGQGGWRPAAAS